MSIICWQHKLQLKTIVAIPSNLSLTRVYSIFNQISKGPKQVTKKFKRGNLIVSQALALPRGRLHAVVIGHVKTHPLLMTAK